MIIMYYGNVRQGKTYSAVLELYQLYKKGYTIYSNTWLSFPYIPLFLKQEDNKFKIKKCLYLMDFAEKELELNDNSVFFIDEIPVWLDSRVSNSKRNRIISYFLSQTGKLGYNSDYGLVIIATAQYPHMVDKRLKSFTDKGIECEKYSVPNSDEKWFNLVITVFRGKKSFQYNQIIKGHPLLFKLYNTRQVIRTSQEDE